ncbi:hypothetical protein NEOLEDRAFT_1173810 [Neolentinus lepideus HHB14362 ss-1]|uniref:Uncharacterized protein n=1 Tax=Neolentinus lepideus HHB14362 ss-1 TaxID=1314782 RepID=A0A165VY44_9AGAM|nr:hypothetical protein NEOLEDRAFT_1173810 [Neolentinus lepideus HHB14362 ss-1]
MSSDPPEITGASYAKLGESWITPATDVLATATSWSSSSPPFPTYALPSPEPSISLSIAGIDAVVVGLSTTFSLTPYVPPSISSYRPIYSALPDGSFVTPTFLESMGRANGLLFALGAFIAFFIRNIIVSISYVRRGRVKHKYLFYALLVSQILGPVGLVPLIVSYFKPLDCTVVNRVTFMSVVLSQSLLMTGILGVKAYRCLSDSKVVLAVISAFQLGIVTCAVCDLVGLQGKKHILGSCALAGHTRFVQIVFFLFCAEGLFICTCFVRALWKSSRTSTIPGRLSIHLTSASEQSVNRRRSTNVQDPPRSRRGWWDYVPEVPKVSEPQSPDGPKTEDKGNGSGMLWASFRWLIMREDVPAYAYQRKPSLPGPYPLRHPGIPLRPRGRDQNTHPDFGRLRGQPHPAQRSPSLSASTRRLGKFIPRMELFKEVMRNELGYTAFLAITCAVSAVLSTVGVNLGLLFSPGGWTGLNWLVMSLLVVHSFSRVVRRHEREALLQHPAAWDPMYRAEEALFTSRHRQPESWRYWSNDGCAHCRTNHGSGEEDRRSSVEKSSTEASRDIRRPGHPSLSWLRPRSSSTSSLPSFEIKTAASTPTPLSSFHAVSVTGEPSIRSVKSASPSESGEVPNDRS